MKKTTEKAFTLIELLAVIVILAIIALIAVPVILNIIDKANKSAFKDTAYGIMNAGELYYSGKQLEPSGMLEDVTITLPDETNTLELKGDIPQGIIKITTEGKIALAVYNNRYCATKTFEETDVTITENVENCVIPVKITNVTLNETELNINEGEAKTIGLTIEPSAATNKTLNYVSSNESVATVDSNGLVTGVSAGTATITITTTDGSNISKTITVNIMEVYENDIMKSTDNCINNGTCASGTEVKVSVNSSETYNFYVVSDTGTELVLIMDRNLGDDVAWYETDTDDSSKGPLTAISALKERTSDWTNIPARSYTYSGIATDNNTRIYADITETMRARMLTYTEVTTTLGCTASSGSCPSWLVTNLSNEKDKYDGYWLPASTPYVGLVSYIYYEASFSISNVYTKHGVRPVITLTK